MKTHYCKAEQAVIDFEGECNWCGEKENRSFEEWYADNVKYMHIEDFKAWLSEAWDAATKAAQK